MDPELRAYAEAARGFMPADDYARELERLVIDIARTSREIRLRTKS